VLNSLPTANDRAQPVIVLVISSGLRRHPRADRAAGQTADRQ